MRGSFSSPATITDNGTFCVKSFGARLHLKGGCRVEGQGDCVGKTNSLWFRYHKNLKVFDATLSVPVLFHYEKDWVLLGRGIWYRETSDSF
jgi:hypothetical protein